MVAIVQRQQVKESRERNWASRSSPANRGSGPPNRHIPASRRMTAGGCVGLVHQFALHTAVFANFFQEAAKFTVGDPSSDAE